MKAQQKLNNEAVIGAYDRWAPVYDIVFGPIFNRGRQAAIEAAERIGGRILEVGIGTGIALRDYSPKNRIVGIDISAQMLEKARMRVSEMGLSHVEQLAVMDASNLDFPDNSFDVVMAQYVVSTVPRPEATLDEFARVLKPGGEIILASRLSEESGIRRSIENFVSPAARKLGWRTEFGWERYLAWEARTPCDRVGRAAKDAAARSFRAHPVPQESRSARRRDRRERSRHSNGSAIQAQ